ncbi:alpha/beta fold hydrolase [Nonomuraea sp. NPDC050540]|uniref:alpha/beta fold hydrolase n=1 Tax=Nonomuraea sp. NPDC050540 TaxID=3364367 RepID=UPI003797EF8B
MRIEPKDLSAHRLSYIETSSSAACMVVFLHGLGLDADDYRDYLSMHGEYHGIAITLLGFNAKSSVPVGPVSLSDHVRMVSELICELSAKNPGKGIVLIGFSLGADIVLRLAEQWRLSAQPAPRITAALLLDPNVNQSTMTISKLFAEADPANPLVVFKKLINLSTDLELLRTLCAYVLKVSRKDFTQLWQLSRDMLEYWNPDGYTQIGERLVAVAGISDEVRVVLSAPYEEHLPSIRDAVRHEPRISFELTDLGHFDLIREDSLSRQLTTASIVNGRVRG